MRTFDFIRALLGASAISALLAGCGGDPAATSTLPTKAANGTFARATGAHHYESIYSFRSSPDGAQPIAGLVSLNGMLYGTTYGGGVRYHSPGTVFEITKTGDERVLYSFSYGSSGSHPLSDLIALKGMLYGTADGGNGLGVAYEVTTSGHLTVLYTFKGNPDGNDPGGPLTVLQGVLYGVTNWGGSGHCFRKKLGCGTVFAISTAGAERVLYSFQRNPRDGQFPTGNLVVVNGSLYGTTLNGGDPKACPGKGCGTVFSVSTSGEEHVLYRFKGPPYDGAAPNGLVAYNNVLYGTSGGGTSGLGMVYSLSLSGKETILRNFTGGLDGAYPFARLSQVNGTLYGTTSAGGAGANCSTGCGTVFKISATKAEQVIYNFQGRPDGSDPISDVTLANGKLYGTTELGGSSNQGTVFRILP